MEWTLDSSYKGDRVQNPNIVTGIGFKARTCAITVVHYI